MNLQKRIGMAVNLLYFSLFILFIWCALEFLRKFNVDEALLMILALVFYGFIIYQIKIGMKWARTVLLLIYISLSLIYVLSLASFIALYDVNYLFIGKSLMYATILFGITILFMAFSIDQLYDPEATEWFNPVGNAKINNEN